MIRQLNLGNNFKDASGALTNAYNRMGAIGSCPGTVKVIAAGENVVALINYDGVKDDGRELDFEIRKKFILTANVDEYNEFEQQSIADGYKVATPYVFPIGEKVVYFGVGVAGNKRPLDDEPDEFDEEYDDEDDYDDDEETE